MKGKAFLQLVAEDLVQKYGQNLVDLVVVFPNNRAKSFFNEYLCSAVNGEPIWTPSYDSIRNLFQEKSNAVVADSIQLVSILYDVYIEVIQKFADESDEYKGLVQETFDQFYFWGEILLSDFDDIDNNLVNAKELFDNIKDQTPFFEDKTYLTEEQKAAIRKFFSCFDGQMDSEMKKSFLRLWKLLYPIYSTFKEKLASMGLAYEGMMKRAVIDDMKDGLGEFPAKKYIFVGFNVLNKCEHALFDRLNKAQKAAFYWDYDEYYMKPLFSDIPMKNEASLFMEKNLKDFKNELNKSHFNSLKDQTNRSYQIIRASTENMQARYVSDYLCQMKKKSIPDRDIAVVLCNESLLLPVLHSIPESVFSVNVTMGLPITQTPIFGMVQLLLNYQDRLFYYNNAQPTSLPSTFLLPLLRNHYLKEAYDGLSVLEEKSKLYKFCKYNDLLSDEKLAELFQVAIEPESLLRWLLAVLRRVASLFKQNEEEDEENHNTSEVVDVSLYTSLYKEAIYRVYTILNRLLSLIQEGAIKDASFTMIQKLIEKMLSTTSVPFSGDQMMGTQIMGFLETRNIDFSHVILLSANEDTLPNLGKESSFVPYNLRRWSGMTTLEHKNSLYAYYFYRLLQRSESVTFLYNSSSDGLSKGQMSRFLMQLKLESGFQIEEKEIQMPVGLEDSPRIEIDKNPSLLDHIRSQYNSLDRSNYRKFSPSSISNLLHCPLSFYLSKMLHLKKEDEVTDEMQNNEFGSIFHASMQYFYQSLMTEKKRAMVQKEDFPEDMKDDYFVAKIKTIVEKAFRTEYFKIDVDAELPALSGDQVMKRDAIIRNILRMLTIDKEYAPFKIISMEQSYERSIDFELSDGSHFQVMLHGMIDRVDEKEGVVRVLDYKTGGSAQSIKDVPAIFSPDAANHYPLQVLLYSYLYKSENPTAKIKPVIAFLKSSQKLVDLDLKIGSEVVEDVDVYLPDVLFLLKEKLKEFFSEQSIQANKSKNSCLYCDFSSICGEC